MPCDTITQVSLELTNANLDLLKKAIEEITGCTARQYKETSLEWARGSYDKRRGLLSCRDTVEAENIKRQYAAETVKAKAARFGWQVKKVDQFKYQVIKR